MGFLDQDRKDAMAISGCVLDASTRMAYCFGIMPDANGIPAIVDAVQEYLAGWPQERIAGLQKIDGGWAPFDVIQRPLRIDDAFDVRRIRDAIRSQCLALRRAGMEPTPDLVELDEFFCTAAEMIGALEQAASQARVPGSRDRVRARRLDRPSRER